MLGKEAEGVLSSSPAWPFPARRCRCSRCRTARSRPFWWWTTWWPRSSWRWPWGSAGPPFALGSRSWEDSNAPLVEQRACERINKAGFTFRCRWRGTPPTWASSRLPEPGSSSPSCPASPHTCRSPSPDCYSGWRTSRGVRSRPSKRLWSERWWGAARPEDEEQKLTKKGATDVTCVDMAVFIQRTHWPRFSRRPPTQLKSKPFITKLAFSKIICSWPATLLSRNELVHLDFLESAWMFPVQINFTNHFPPNLKCCVCRPKKFFLQK